MNTNSEIKQETIELSISKNYVSNWGFWEAMREIIQNAIDSESDGHKAFINLANNGTDLMISNEDVILPINSLVLGNSDKGTTHIGKFGEGYKLALVVLLRLGYSVTILSGKNQWIPSFQYSSKFDTEVLCITIMENANPYLNTSDTTFIIHGLTESDLDLLKDNCLLVRRCLGLPVGKTIECEYGLILTDEHFAGKFYVEGLFIQDDTSFKFGYSFKNEYVDLDRDRRAINYYDLLELTTNSLLSQTEDVKIVETCLVDKEKDIKNLEEFYTSIPQEFATNYADHFLEKNNLTEDTFIGTEKEALVSGNPNVFITDKIQARIVNKGLNREQEYNEVKDLAQKKDNRDLSYKYYEESTLCKLHDWIIVNCNKLSTKQINEFLTICWSIEPSGFKLIKRDIYDNLLQRIYSRTPSYKGGFSIETNESK